MPERMTEIKIIDTTLLETTAILNCVNACLIGTHINIHDRLSGSRCNFSFLFVIFQYRKIFQIYIMMFLSKTRLDYLLDVKPHFLRRHNNTIQI